VAETYPVDDTPDRPEVVIKVDGTEVEPLIRLDVLEVDVTEEVGRHGRVSLLLRNWDADALEVTHSDGQVFAPGVALQVLLGYGSELHLTFDGLVTGLRARFGSAAGPTVEVQGRTRSVLLDGPSRSFLREDVSDGDVASELAARVGLGADTHEGVVQSAVVSHRRTDWSYLVERASALGYVTYARGDRLVFRPPAAADGELPVLAWGRTLLELDLDRRLGGRSDPSEATGWDPEHLEVRRSEASSADAGVVAGDRPTPAEALRESGWDDQGAQLPTAAPVEPIELDRIARGAADLQALRHVAGHARTIGLAQLRCDSWLDVTGVGRSLSGPHYVTAVRHRLGRTGFTTELQLGLPEPLLPPPVATADHLLLGVVEDLDDPRAATRVKVGFPWLADAPEAVWARLVSLEAGPDHGTLFVPDVGQEVLVGFVDGDRRHPVVLGSLWNGRQAAPIPVGSANDIRTITSRSGHAVTFDDGDQGSVEVTTSGGRHLTLDDADGSVGLTDASGNHVTLDGQGITLEAARGDIVLKAAGGRVVLDAAGLEVSSTGPAKVESTATLDLKAAASLSVNGGLVRIN
jgi:phage protein D/phage baseplate assembly protein gpV